MKSMDLIFISLESWDEIWRRNQFVCAGLVQKNPELRILFVEPARDLSNAIRTGRLSSLTRALKRPDASMQITFTSAWKLLPNSWAWGRKVNQWLLRGHLRRIARKLGFQSSVLWINDHSAAHLAGRLGESAVVYDVTDDWSVVRQSEKAAELIREQDRQLCAKADAVLVCSQSLFEMKAPLSKAIYLAPNGVDPGHYGTANDRDLPLPAEAQQWRRPVLGYTGSVHPERVDISLVEAIARRLPLVTLAFVGPLMLPESDYKRLTALPNVVLAGPRPYAKIPDYVRAFDICMTPHVVTPFTESLNPIKLWDYLAIGKPIISTPVAGFRDYPELVYLASNAEQFATAVGDALSEDRALSAARQAEASNHSWEIRVGQIWEILRPFLGDLQPKVHYARAFTP